MSAGEADVPALGGGAGRGWGLTGVIVFVVGFAARVVAGLSLNLTPYGLRGYWLYKEMARNLLDGEGLRFRYYAGLSEAWANRPPLYGLFVAGVESVFGPAPEPLLLAQSALGALTAVLVARLAFERGGRLAGLAAGGLAALYPYYVGNDTTIVEQPLFACLLTAFALVFARPGAGLGRALACGAFGGLAALTRETFVPFFGLAIVAAFFVLRPGRAARRFAWCGACAAAFLLVSSPWLVRNALRFGAPGYSFSSGKALWVGNNPDTFAKYPGESIDFSEWVAWGRLSEDRRRWLMSAPDERELQARYRVMAMDHIRADPARFLRGGFRKVWALLTPVLTPRSPSALKRLSYGASYVPVVLLALVGAVFGGRRFRSLALLAGLLLLALCMTAFVFWGQTRIRSPADVLLIALAGGGVAVLAACRGRTAKLSGAHHPTVRLMEGLAAPREQVRPPR